MGGKKRDISLTLCDRLLMVDIGRANAMCFCELYCFTLNYVLVKNTLTYNCLHSPYCYIEACCPINTLVLLQVMHYVVTH